MSVFAPKGGVGKTTIAFNLAVALGQLGQRTVLIDGSLQFGDLRSLLKVPGRRAVDPRPADRPHRRVRPSRRPVARPVGHRHPARSAAHRDGRDAHAARHRQGPVAPAPGLRARSSSTCRATSTTSTSRSSTRAMRSSRSSPTTRRRSTTRSPWPTRSGRSATRPTKVRYLVNRADSPAASTRSTSSRRSAACRTSRRVRRPARGPVQQRGRAVRAGQPRRGDQPRTSCGSPASSLNAGRDWPAVAGRS